MEHAYWLPRKRAINRMGRRFARCQRNFSGGATSCERRYHYNKVLGCHRHYSHNLSMSCYHHTATTPPPLLPSSSFPSFLLAQWRRGANMPPSSPFLKEEDSMPRHGTSCHLLTKHCLWKSHHEAGGQDRRNAHTTSSWACRRAAWRACPLPLLRRLDATGSSSRWVLLTRLSTKHALGGILAPTWHCHSGAQLPFILGGTPAWRLRGRAAANSSAASCLPTTPHLPSSYAWDGQGGWAPGQLSLLPWMYIWRDMREPNYNTARAPLHAPTTHTTNQIHILREGTSLCHLLAGRARLLPPVPSPV